MKNRPASTVPAGGGSYASSDPSVREGALARAATASKHAGDAGQSTKGRTARTRGAHGSAGRAVHNQRPSELSAQAPDVIQRIVREVPEAVWIALGVALLLAALAALAALRNGVLARRRAREFEEVALVDPLTGVLNRRGFAEAVERELDRAKRHDHSLELAFIDVRGMKAVNDTEGHLAGDMLLRETASLLRESARAHDFVGRLGGDELAVLLVEKSVDPPEVVVDRIKTLVTLRRATSPLKVDWDLTIGTSSYPDDGETFEKLLGVADRRLYQQRGIALR